MALAGGRRQLRVDTSEVVVVELELERTDVLLEVLAALGARDRNDVVALGEDPGERELCRCRILLGSEVCNLPSQLEQVVEKMTELEHNLELIDYKIGLYRERAAD